MNPLFTFILHTLLSHSDPSSPYDFVVDKNGTGDFTSVQAAIDAVPNFRSARTVIFIKAGTFKEKILVAEVKTNITLIGEDVKATILTYDDHAKTENRFGEQLGTSGSSSCFINGDGFEARNITFENAAGPDVQAVAVRVDADKSQFVNCRFLGNQDTLYPHGEGSRQCYQSCYIEGTVDFIFGGATALFDSCTIFCKSGGYITAASTSENNAYGFVFINCKITGNAPNNSVYLGRPWKPFAKTVFINCEMDAVVQEAGWHNWGNKENEKTAFYAEYGNKGPGYTPNNRVSWAHQLSEEKVDSYSPGKVFGDWKVE